MGATRPADLYAGAARGWATGAARVYRPIAAALLEMAPAPLAGCTVLDAGAGTGVGSESLTAAGATVVAADLSLDMLAWDRARRPPAVVADVHHLPLRAAAVDHVVAAFVLNHLSAPVPALAELRRVARPGGAILASVFNVDSRSVARDAVDAVAQDHGWEVPEWYREVKEVAMPLLGSAGRMREAAVAAGLLDVVVVERPVDTGVDRAEDLVDYRFGQAQFASWISALSPAAAAAARAAAVAEIADVMEPYRPIVVMLAGRTPLRSGAGR